MSRWAAWLRLAEMRAFNAFNPASAIRIVSPCFTSNDTPRRSGSGVMLSSVAASRRTVPPRRRHRRERSENVGLAHLLAPSSVATAGRVQQHHPHLRELRTFRGRRVRREVIRDRVELSVDRLFRHLPRVDLPRSDSGFAARPCVAPLRCPRPRGFDPASSAARRPRNACRRSWISFSFSDDCGCMAIHRSHLWISLRVWLYDKCSAGVSSTVVSAKSVSSPKTSIPGGVLR